MCEHVPCCPPAGSVEARTAHVRAAHPEQGWCLLCNGVICFDDGGAILPDGHVLDPAPRSAGHAA
jgi:hypothetical protein